MFQKRLAEDGIDPKKEPERAAGKWIDNVWHGRAHTWEKMPWLIKTWKEMSEWIPRVHVEDPMHHKPVLQR